MRRIIAIAILIVLSSTTYISAGTGEEKYEQFVEALKGSEDQEVIFSQSEAVTVLNAGAQVMFKDMPSVSARCSEVVIRGDLIELTTALTVAGITVYPRVTLTARAQGEDVVIEIKRMRIGYVPMSVTAMLAAIRAVGCPEYMQVYPLAGKVVVRKRGYVRYVDSINVTTAGIRVFVLGR